MLSLRTQAACGGRVIKRILLAAALLQGIHRLQQHTMLSKYGPGEPP